MFALSVLLACSAGKPAPGTSSAGGDAGAPGGGTSSTAGGAAGTNASGSGGVAAGGSGTAGASGSGTSGASGNGASGSGTSGSGASGASGNGAAGGGMAGGSGAAGAGGTAGASGSAGAAGSGGGGTGCTGSPLCDDFETDVVGAAPNATRWAIVSGCGGNDPQSTVTIDSSQHHSGNNSVKVVGGTNTCGPIFSNTSAFSSLGNSIYGRFYVRFSVATQMSHSMFMGLGFAASGVPSQVNDNLEMTQQYGVYVWNLHDKTLPNIAPSASTPMDTWTCIEFHTDATNGNLDTWIDGAAVPQMTFDPGVTAVQTGNGGNDSWSGYTMKPSPFKPTSVSFGWVTFGGSPATVWFDDIALGPSRILCN